MTKTIKGKLKELLIIIDMTWIHFTGMYTGTTIRTLDNDFPYFTRNATAWLKTFLKPDMKVFEWGSGSSTIFFARRVQQIISIEYSKEWTSKVKYYLWLKNIYNCEVKFIPPEKELNYGDIKDLKNCLSNSPDFVHRTFKKYVHSIENYQKKSFDLIIVDGRARPSCLALAREYIKIDGYIILDDSERETYTEACKLLTDNFVRTDFEGHDIYHGYEMMTSIFKRIK